ncbi:MAG: hypothetical protein P8K78_05525 [Pirellulales bacterium]|nr:hypothetical protein [Pirellulales bacterium]
MKNDLIFSCIALPFTIGFGMAASQPLWAMAVFVAMLVLRYAAAPAPTVVRSQAGTISRGERGRKRPENKPHFG